MTARALLYSVWQLLPLVTLTVLLGMAFGWAVAVLIALALAALVVFGIVAKRRRRDLSRLSWPIVFGLILAAFGAATRDLVVVMGAGILGLVIGAIGEIPLRKRSGELYTDGELARVGGLFFASLFVALFVILVVATVARAT